MCILTVPDNFLNRVLRARRPLWVCSEAAPRLKQTKGSGLGLKGWGFEGLNSAIPALWFAPAPSRRFLLKLSRYPSALLRRCAIPAPSCRLSSLRYPSAWTLNLKSTIPVLSPTLAGGWWSRACLQGPSRMPWGVLEYVLVCMLCYIMLCYVVLCCCL